LSRKERPRIELSTVNKILLVRLRRIGDVVMTSPAITALKKSLPHASLTYIVEEPYRRLVEGNPRLDRVISLPADQGLLDFLGFIRNLRRVKYDALIDFHGGPRASRIAFLARARVKVGYKLKYKNFIYDIRLPRSRKGGYFHSVENHLNLVKALGIAVLEPPPLELPPARPEEKKRIDAYWAENDLERTKAVIFHIGAGNAFRDWGAQNLATLAGLLAGRSGVRIILVGSAGDKARQGEILAAVRQPVLSLVAELNLIELLELLGRATLFVGPDSGPMHIAAAAGTPIVALFGPTLPENFGPWQAKATLIARDLDCRPCRQRRCIMNDFRCLRSIRPEEVYDACLNYLG
jgi:lipopolysaccharide heptosyltransferase II